MAEYTHLDAQGTPVVSTKADGSINWRERYTPFGEKTLDNAKNQNDIGYTGHVQDEASGLTYMQARYYDPVAARFLSTDPIGYQDQLNLYAYVANDPINATDPTGMIAQEIDYLDDEWRQGIPIAGGRPIGLFDENNTNEPSQDSESAWSIDPATNGAAKDGSLEVLGFAVGFKGIDKAFKGGLAWAMGKEAAEEVAEHATVRLADDIAGWLGPKYMPRQVEETGNYVYASADGLRRFRIDFTQNKGLFKGPHGVFESRVATNRPFRPVDGTPEHIYFTGK